MEDDEAHIFGDLFIDPNGNMLVSDGIQSITYYLEIGKLEKWLLPDSILWLQGVIKIDGTLFYADYVNGIYAIDLTSEYYYLINILNHLSLTLRGIDGLYVFEGNLIAIQNGVKPYRIARIKLNKNHNKIESNQYIENYHPAMGEPTLGYISNSELYYIANSLAFE